LIQKTGLSFQGRKVFLDITSPTSGDHNDDSDDGGCMNLNIAVKIPELVQSWRNKNTEPIKT